MILSRTLEYSSRLPVSVCGTGVYTLNIYQLFLEAPSVIRRSRSLVSTPYSVRTYHPRHSVISKPVQTVWDY